MIVVKTLDEFQIFIDLAKKQNQQYAILGSETTGFEGVTVLDDTPNHNRFFASYALICPLFTVFVQIKLPVEDKKTITDISADFHFTPFKHLTFKDGILDCHN